MEPKSSPRGVELGFEHVSNSELGPNLGPTWAPGGGQRTKVFVSFSHLGTILDPNALRDPKTIDFLSIWDRFFIDFGIDFGIDF